MQHALRAFTPRDQKAVKAAAETFRPSPKLDTAQVITELGKGEALVSFLDSSGVPTPVQRAAILRPAHIGMLTTADRKLALAHSPVRGKYDQAFDRESAYDVLNAPPPLPAPPPPSREDMRQNMRRWLSPVFAVIGLLLVAAVVHPAVPDTTNVPQAAAALTVPEQVQQAVYQQHSCRPQLEHIESVGSDKSGSGYMIGCGAGFYFALVRPTGAIEITDIHGKWNGH